MIPKQSTFFVHPFEFENMKWFLFFDWWMLNSESEYDYTFYKSGSDDESNHKNTKDMRLISNFTNDAIFILIYSHSISLLLFK
jgi:hypothetical protein